jgi:hypothetical protein
MKRPNLPRHIEEFVFVGSVDVVDLVIVLFRLFVVPVSIWVLVTIL